MEEERDLQEELRELLETRQYTRLRQTLADMNEADIAAVMDEMEDEVSLKMFRMLPKDMAADVFAQLEIDAQQYIITSLSDKEAGNVIDNLMADDATDLLEEMPANVVRRILANAQPETRADINNLLRYPEDSAGSIMTVEYVDLKEEMTVADAIERIRKIGLDSETVSICYVIDNSRILKGTVALRYLLIHDPEDRIGDFMNETVISIKTTDDQEEAADKFRKYDLIVMPVVDNEMRMVGIITIDDVVDIIDVEATEDIEKMAAMIPSDKPYLKTGIFETYKKRMPWLMLLMISATFTGKIMARYESALATYTILTVFVPMLMDTAGNAGSQASTSIIRGLSLDEIEPRNFLSVIFKEWRVALLCGGSLALINLVKLLVIDRVPLVIAGVVCVTMVCVVMFAKCVGSMMPLIAQKIGLDPAVVAAPMLTTIVDAVALIIYFTISTRVLHIAM